MIKAHLDKEAKIKYQTIMQNHFNPWHAKCKNKEKGKKNVNYSFLHSYIIFLHSVLFFFATFATAQVFFKKKKASTTTNKKSKICHIKLNIVNDFFLFYYTSLCKTLSFIHEHRY